MKYSDGGFCLLLKPLFNVFCRYKNPISFFCKFGFALSLSESTGVLGFLTGKAGNYWLFILVIFFAAVLLLIEECPGNDKSNRNS